MPMTVEELEAMDLLLGEFRMLGRFLAFLDARGVGRPEVLARSRARMAELAEQFHQMTQEPGQV